MSISISKEEVALICAVIAALGAVIAVFIGAAQLWLMIHDQTPDLAQKYLDIEAPLAHDEMAKSSIEH